MGSSIRAAFDVAAIVGVRLLDTDPTTLSRHPALVRDRPSLRPKAVRSGTEAVTADF